MQKYFFVFISFLMVLICGKFFSEDLQSMHKFLLSEGASISNQDPIKDHLVGYWEIKKNPTGYLFEGSILTINNDNTFTFSHKLYEEDPNNLQFGVFEYVRRYKSDYIYKVDMNVAGNIYYYKIRYYDTYFLLSDFSHTEYEALSKSDFVSWMERVSYSDL